MRVQRLVNAVASPGAVVIGEAVKQVAVAVGLVTATVAGQAGKHVGYFRRSLIGFAGTPLKELGGKRRR